MLPAPSASGSDDTQARAAVVSGTPSWRKRHPHLARGVLYGLGLAVAVVGVWLVLQRKDVDRCDRLCGLWSRLSQLPIVVQADPSGAVALKVLDEEFSDPTLPDDMKARALRLRGVLANLQKDVPAMNAAFAKARELGGTRDDVDALALEWAYCRLEQGDPVGAGLLLKGLEPKPPVLALWKHLITARLRDATGEGVEGRAALVRLLDALPRPVPAAPPMWFMLDEWRLETVLIEAARWLVAGLPAKSEAARPIWKRLAEQAPAYPDALVAASEGLVEAGDVVAARKLWGDLKRLDPDFAAAASKQRPTLRGLEAP